MATDTPAQSIPPADSQSSPKDEIEEIELHDDQPQTTPDNARPQVCLCLKRALFVY